MKKISILICFLLLSISFISAIIIYSGESIILELEKPYEYYSIVGNSSEVILDVYQEGNIIYITPDKYSSSDTYKIIFFDREKEVITITSGGGGGGGSSRTIYKNNTEYVEVPNYLDREVEKEIIKEIPSEPEIVKEVSLWIITFLIFLVILVITFWKLYLKEKYTSERGLNEDE